MTCDRDFDLALGVEGDKAVPARAEVVFFRGGKSVRRRGGLDGERDLALVLLGEFADGVLYGAAEGSVATERVVVDLRELGLRLLGGRVDGVALGTGGDKNEEQRVGLHAPRLCAPGGPVNYATIAE